MTFLVAILSFFLGFLIASYLSHCDAKRKEKDWQQRLEQSKSKLSKARAAVKQLENSEQHISFDQETAAKKPAQPLRREPPKPEPASERAAVSPRKSPREEGAYAGKSIDQIFGEFESAESLKLNFNHIAPDSGSSHFVQGEGYVRNRRNELLPDRQTFRRINTGASYATSGLFWVFDVSSGGRTYTYQQLLNGALGSGYVQIRGIKRPALVEKQTGLSCYTLLQKGLLEVADQ